METKTNPMVVGYRHTGIITKNIKESIYFYNEILGLEIIQEFEDSSPYINESINKKRNSELN